MGRYSRRIARGGVRESLHSERRGEQRKERFVTLMTARWVMNAERLYPQHRFYVAGILAEDAPKVRAEGVRTVYAVPKSRPAPQGWWEIVPLEEAATLDDGGYALFGIRTAPGQLTPLKLHPTFTVDRFAITPSITITKEAEQHLVAKETPQIT